MDISNRVVCYRGLKTVLRPIDADNDLPFFMKWINDTEVNKFLKVLGPLTSLQERSYLESIGKDHNNVIFAIETLEEGKLIGSMGIHRIEWTSGVATTGSIIGDKDYWGKGYGTDAKMLLLHHAFHRLGLRRICSSVISYNKRSARCLEKCGYKQEGVRKGMYFRNGKYYDQILFKLFRPDFDRLWKSHSKLLTGFDETPSQGR